MKKKLSWRPAQRIRERRIFRFLFKKGHFARGAFLNLWSYQKEIAGSGNAGPRLGVIVSRKTDSRATARNLWKRRMRESFRKSQHRIKSEAWILMEARRGQKEIPSYDQIAEDMEKLLLKTGSLK